MRAIAIGGAIVALAALTVLSGLVVAGLTTRSRLENEAEDAPARAAACRCPDHVEAPDLLPMSPYAETLAADLRATLDLPLDEWARPS